MCQAVSEHEGRCLTDNMALYLVDYENTGVRGINGIEGLRSFDRLIILYGPKTGSVPFEDMVKITSSPAALEFIKTTKTAKNYLDFQLVSYLGYLIAEKAAEQYYIVSRDSGFDSAVDLWTERSVSVKRINDLTGDTTPEEKPVRRQSSRGRSRTSEDAVNAPKPEADEDGKKNPKTDKPGANREKAADKKADKQKTDKIKTNRSKPDKTKTPEKERAQEKEEPSGSQGTVLTVPESVKKRVRTALKAEGLRPGAYRKLYACMIESEDKSSFNTALVHAFGQETANKYYKQVLPAFTTWKSI